MHLSTILPTLLGVASPALCSLIPPSFALSKSVLESLYPDTLSSSDLTDMLIPGGLNANQVTGGHTPGNPDTSDDWFSKPAQRQRYMELASRSPHFFNNSRLAPFFQNDTLDEQSIREQYARGDLLVVDVCSNSTNATQHVYWVSSVESTTPLGNPGPIELRGTRNCTRSFMTPGYMGNIRAGADWNGDGTKVEMSFGQQEIFRANDITRPILDVDVSFVDGWNGQLVCSCRNKPIVGCSEDLAALGGPCPKPSKEGSTCFNPMRDLNGGSGPAHPWFEPCKGGSYLFPLDDLANNNDACSTNHLVCCAGPGCPDGVSTIP
jgi:hypothetical protein